MTQIGIWTHSERKRETKERDHSAQTECVVRLMFPGVQPAMSETQLIQPPKVCSPLPTQVQRLLGSPPALSHLPLPSDESSSGGARFHVHRMKGRMSAGELSSCDCSMYSGSAEPFRGTVKVL